MGLCWVRRHSAASSMRNSARALRFQLHDRLAATAASPAIRSGRAGALVLGMGHPACKLRPGGAAWEARRVAANGRCAQVSPSAMTATSAPTVRRHHWIVRVTHWATVIVLAGMIASGLQIYEAYARFGNRGGPYFVSPPDRSAERRGGEEGRTRGGPG